MDRAKHELQEILGTPSPDGDGLSFAQGCVTCRPFMSDIFSTVDEVIDVRDYVNFSDGIVSAGATVEFFLAITDSSPIDTFYLRQRPNFQVSNVPEPGALALFGLGLLGLSFSKKRKAA